MTDQKVILITGSEGALGKRVARALEKQGHVVVGFDVIKGDDILDEPKFLEKLKTSGATVVIHLAAVADLNIARVNPQLCHDINIKGTEIVLRCCEAVKARMLFASTCCIYGNAHHDGPATEESETAPTEIYAQSKKDGEKIIRAVGAPHTCMRLATFYGPGMRPALSIALFLKAVHEGRPINVHGTGTQTRTFTYVDDIVSGIVTIANSKQWHPVINITTTESTSVLQLAEYCMDVVGKKVELVHVADREGQILHENIDNSLLKSLGWTPKVSMREGVKLSYEAWMNELRAQSSA